MTSIIDKIMVQVQVYASAWSLVGSRFDKGDELANAEAEKLALRTLVADALRQTIFVGVDLASGPDMSVEGLLYADELVSHRQLTHEVEFAGLVQSPSGALVHISEMTAPASAVPPVRAPGFSCNFPPPPSPPKPGKGDPL